MLNWNCGAICSPGWGDWKTYDWNIHPMDPVRTMQNGNGGQLWNDRFPPTSTGCIPVNLKPITSNKRPISGFF